MGIDSGRIQNLFMLKIDTGQYEYNEYIVHLKMAQWVNSLTH